MILYTVKTAAEWAKSHPTITYPDTNNYSAVPKDIQWNYIRIIDN